ncbi:hypothetical protein [Nocardia sp. NPDC049149]|uniref:hypothetical protein n=1 Tax=Nocardia sp. NPDC049149 TaxID=3364315 RepID=UPI0037231E96
MILGATTVWSDEVAVAAPSATRTAQEVRMDRQTVSVKGRLLCSGQPSTSTQSRVQLVNKRIGQDDVQKMYPSKDGTFAVTLVVESIAKMTPQLDIFTSCNAAPAQCRLITLSVPDRYVDAANPYDVGSLHLETRLDDESSC